MTSHSELELKTDLTKWKLSVDRGRQVWEYHPDGCAQTVVERYLLSLDTSGDLPPLPRPSSPLDAARNGARFYAGVQAADGHWAHDYGGPLFLLPGLLIACYVAQQPLPAGCPPEMARYLLSCQRPDGGWGLHIESPSTVFGTVLSYVSLRLLGLPPAHPALAAARAFLLPLEGAKGIPSWGKFWLAALNLYGWDGLDPIPPELWLLPYRFPAHPGRFWCHCRMVYLPMSYVYARRLSCPPTPLVRSLRAELYPCDPDYDAIDWPSLRGFTSPLDVYTHHPPFLRALNALMAAYEGRALPGLRQRALELAADHIRFEDECSDYIDIGPVNKALNMLAVFYIHGPSSEQLRRHAARVPDYLWLAADGMKMQGYNGSQLWDTAFSVQAFVAAGLGGEFRACLRRAYGFLDEAQVLEDVPDRDRYFRHISKGAWPFSTRQHGWPISDCTAEGLKAALQLAALFEGDAEAPALLPEGRLCDAVNVILSLQNEEDGGWATYENKRGSDFVEMLNPSEVFHNIMVDYSYVECTSACLQALAAFQRGRPGHRQVEIATAIADGADFIRRIQRPDGSWIGSWGVCFTYGTWFGVLGLLAVGEPRGSPAIQRAVGFLLSKQQQDGGWGETFGSCETMEYVQNARSQVVNTAWALLTLVAAGYSEDISRLERAAQLLMARQLPDGNWLQEDISGVFNANCAISYSGYKNIFPIWALGAYSQFRNQLGDQISIPSKL